MKKFISFIDEAPFDSKLNIFIEDCFFFVLFSVRVFEAVLIYTHGNSRKSHILAKSNSIDFEITLSIVRDIFDNVNDPLGYPDIFHMKLIKLLFYLFLREKS